MIKLMTFGFIFCLVFAMLLAPLVIPAIKKLKASQTVLHYVEAHKSKDGTPTMGGIIFLIPIIFASIIICGTSSKLCMLTVSVTLGYALLGFLDDFIKVRFKQNMGLHAYQKIIGQVGIGLIIGLYVYFSNLVPNTILLPFSNNQLYLGWGIIPFVVLVFISVTNSVNLTDGLDGLAGGVSFVYLLFFGAILGVLLTCGTWQTTNSLIIQERESLAVLTICGAGSLLGFLSVNSFPAKIFMGDTGSLAIGGFIASISCLTTTQLFIPILGIMFVVSALSVIMQVIYYKKTKKRIFLMAPLHHHFEKKGVHENKVVTIYILITTIIGAITLLLTQVINGV